MKLLLTSDGLSSNNLKKQFLKLLDKPPKENRVLVMHTSIGIYKKYLRRIKKSLTSLGIPGKNIVYANISKNLNSSKFNDFDVFYSCGGNTFYILDRIRKTGFDRLIKRFINSGKLYLGVSAGSIIVHKTIELAGWGSEADINFLKLKNLRGLGITNIAVFPHFHKSIEKQVRDFKKIVDYPIMEIRDKHAVLILDKQKRVI